MSKSQAKSAYNQSRAEQNRVQGQYDRMWGPNGTARQTFAPVTTAANSLLKGGGETPEMSADITGGLNAARRRAAGAVASQYGNLQDALNRAYARQGGYAPGFNANQQAIARQSAEQQALSSAQPEEYYSGLDIGTRLQGLGLGGNLAAAPYEAQLRALGLTNADIADMIRTQAGIGQTPGFWSNYGKGWTGASGGALGALFPA